MTAPVTLMAKRHSDGLADLVQVGWRHAGWVLVDVSHDVQAPHPWRDYTTRWTFRHDNGDEGSFMSPDRYPLTGWLARSQVMNIGLRSAEQAAALEYARMC